ncbi:MAG: hypothetical protein ACM3US_11260 [Sphingomonadaceae bacterium]
MIAGRSSAAATSNGGVLSRLRDSLRRHRLVFFLALVLNLADALSTHIGLAAGLPEGNPVPAMLHANGSQLAMFGVGSP